MRKTRSLSRADIQAQVRARKEQFDEANEKITARSGRNLVSAILIGVVLAGVMVVSLVVIKELFMVLAVVLVTFGVLELATAFRHASIHVPRVPSVIAGVAMVPAAYYWGAPGQWLVALAGMLLVALWRVGEVVLQHPRPTPLGLVRDLGAGTFVQVYVSFLGSIAVLLLSKDGGQWWVLAFILTVVLVDVGAYATGLNVGKHPMAPTISPKKTWGGIRRRGRGRSDRRGAARDLHARAALVGRPHLRCRHHGHCHRRRPLGVSAEARHRYQGHELVASRSRRIPRPARLDPALRRGGVRALGRVRELTGRAVSESLAQ